MYLQGPRKPKIQGRLRPPGVLETCKRLWLDRQIALIDPTSVVLLGKIPITQALNEPSNLKESHGQMQERNGPLVPGPISSRCGSALYCPVIVHCMDRLTHFY